MSRLRKLMEVSPRW